MVVGVVALGVALVQDEVPIRHAVHAHVHDRLVTHADGDASFAVGAIAADLLMLALFVRVAHAILFVIVRLAAWALRRRVAEPLLGTL